MKIFIVISLNNTNVSSNQFRESFLALRRELPFFKILYVDQEKNSPTSFYSKIASGDGSLSIIRLRATTKIGPGAFRKLAYRHAITGGFDYVVPLSWNHHTNLKTIPLLIKTMEQNKCDVAVGVDQRPLWKKILTFTWLGMMRQLLSWILKSFTKEKSIAWPARYLIYRTTALRNIPFELNTNGPHFDYEVLLQLANQNVSMRNIDISSILYRGLGIPFRPNLFLNILKASIKYRLRQYHLFFDIRYELAMDLKPSVAEGSTTSVYEEKMSSLSPHSLVCQDNSLIPSQSHVLDIGCATGYVCQSLSRQKNCTTEGVDRLNADQFSGGRNSTYHKIDLDHDWDSLNRVIDSSPCDVVLLLDVVEHLSQPELFLINLYQQRFKKNPKFLISTGNVAFIVTRLMLMAGFFNYGKKGILDITHKRLFTSRNFKNLMEQTGFITRRMTYFPVPFKALGWPSPLAGFLEQLNRLLIKISPSWFAYQMMVEAIHLPSSSDWTGANPT